MMNFIVYTSTVFFLVFYQVINAEDSSEFGITMGARSTNCSCGWRNRSPGRIIGGEEAGLHEYPLIAALVTPKLMIGFCGGSIITEYHVLTAAHCFPPMEGRELAVSVGEHDLNRKDETPYTQVIPIERVIMHAEYTRLGQHNDIALAVLKSRIEFNQQVGPACLPYQALDLEGKKVLVIGWGRTTAKGSSSDILLKVELDVQPLSYCVKSYSYLRTSPPRQLCTHTKDKDSCKGDSGGPLLYRDPATNRYVVVGIVSFGKSCASKHGGVWTDVFAYKEWIQQKIAETNHGVKTCQ
uniref:Venom S1 protease 10 n=1 Tax=Ectomocoris sp. TaxID=3104572 RepID=A0AB38ZE62_9HEMI